MSKVIQFDLEKREIEKHFEAVKEYINTCDPKEVENLFFFVKTKKIHVASFNPDWEMLGFLRCFLRDLEELLSEDLE